MLNYHELRQRHNRKSKDILLTLGIPAMVVILTAMFALGVRFICIGIVKLDKNVGQQWREINVH